MRIKKRFERVKVGVKSVLPRQNDTTVNRTQAHKDYLLGLLYTRSNVKYSSDRPPAGMKEVKFKMTRAHKAYLVAVLQNRKFKGIKLRYHSLVAVNAISIITLAQESNLLASVLKS